MMKSLIDNAWLMMTTVLDRHQNRPITAHSTRILLIKYRSHH